VARPAGAVLALSDELGPVQERAEAEARAYAEALAALDRLASFALPVELQPDLPAQMERLNQLWSSLPPPAASGFSAPLQSRVWDVVAPRFDRQQDFNSVVVQVLNSHHAETARVFAHLRELVQALVGYVQRVEPSMDARDRQAAALATTRAELILEAFDRRQESFARRLQALLALRDRVEAMGEEVRAVRATLQDPPAAPIARAAAQAASDSIYAAFENRFRGDSAEVRERLAGYVGRLRDHAPVVDVGCGRGELLQLLRDGDVAALGVDGNARFVQECRARGLEVAEGDLLDFLEALAPSSQGAVVGIQVAEHLPPPALQRLLQGAHRALRPGGLLLLETVNPRSVVGLLEVYNRDLTHEKPLHPDTLSFLAAAAGFTEVAVEMRAPVEPAARLQPIPTDGLPAASARALNENVERLNGLLYGPQEYVLIATR
jgi:SAM-dependent methyltransferase